jgi:hypothetical protein
MFSIADIQNMEDEAGLEQENDESGDNDTSESYPIRVSFSVTKVGCVVVVSDVLVG